MSANTSIIIITQIHNRPANRKHIYREVLMLLRVLLVNYIYTKDNKIIRIQTQFLGPPTGT